MADPNPKYICVSSPIWTFVDNNGDPASGYKLYVYESSGTSFATCYQTPTGTAHSNPITLNSRGEVANDAGTAKPIFGNQDYKFILTDADGIDDGVTYWTADTIHTPQPTEFAKTLIANTTASDARDDLGLGDAATKNTGVTNGTIPLMDSTGYPEANGSQITNLSAANIDSLPLPRGHIAGLQVSRNNDQVIDISIGECVENADSGNHTAMRLTTAYTKNVASAWGVGSDSDIGCLDTGSLETDEWYHVFIIRRSDTGVVDVLTSKSATNPTMPDDYDSKRRIGSFKTYFDGTIKIIDFTQIGDTFLWAAEQEQGLTTVGTGESNITLSHVPDGFKVEAIFNANAVDTSKATHLTLSSYDTPPTGLGDPENDPDVAHGNLYQDETHGACGHFRLMTNASAQIKALSETSGTLLYIWTLGYVDRRGRDD